MESLKRDFKDSITGNNDMLKLMQIHEVLDNWDNYVDISLNNWGNVLSDRPETLNIIINENEILKVEDLPEVMTENQTFSLLTWNIEHYGFTSNGRVPEQKFWELNNWYRFDGNNGFLETSQGLQQRIERVISNIKEYDLIGLNEIGGVAYKYLKSGIDILNSKGSQYILKTGGKDLDEENIQYLKEGDNNFSMSFQYGSEPELESVYANVCIINTNKFDIIESYQINYPHQELFRRTNLLFNKLKYKNQGENEYEFIWLHTHFAYDRNSEEKKGQKKTIQSIINAYESFDIILSGDFYMYDTEMTGFINTNNFKRLSSENINYRNTYTGDPHAEGRADNIFLRSRKLTNVINQTQIVPFDCDPKLYNTRRELSDHCGLKTLFAPLEGNEIISEGNENSLLSQNVQTLMDMGFTQEQAQTSLLMTEDNIERAMDLLLSGHV